MWNYRQLPQLSKTSSKKKSRTPCLVSVMIPARNEEKKIGEYIKTLKAQTYPNLEVIIVDDYSTDNTVKIAKSITENDKRFKILCLKDIKEEKPSGWMGKSYAIQQGSTQAKGEWLLFSDVDYADHDQELIERAVRYAIENKVDLLSLIGNNICKSFWEKVIQPIPLGILPVLSPLAKVNKPESKVAIAFGPFILINHAVFKKVGGYQTIKSQIADDAEIAKLVKNAGFTIKLVNAQTMMSIRMYEKFSDIWEGWSKNIFLGLVQKRDVKSKMLQVLLVLAGSIGVFGMMVFPFLAMIISLLMVLFTHSNQWQYLLALSFIIWCYVTFVQFSVQKHYYIGNPRYALLTFLGGTITIGIFINSAIKTLSRKGVTWKGRVYANKKS